MLKRFVKYLFWLAALIFVLTGCGGGGGGGGDNGGTTASTTATVNLECEPIDAAYNESVTLNWSSTNAETCTASGSWSGDKTTSGSETIDSLTDDGTFIITCTDDVGGSVSDSVTVTVTVNNAGTASLSWTPPTKNTDGTDLTDLAGYYIHIGTSSGDYSSVIEVRQNDINSFLVEDLAEGTWYFALSAFDTSGNESEKSNEGSKVITP